MQATSNAIKKSKEKSKQIKTLEKLVQHGAAYMHPQARPALNRNTTTSLMRDKISEQQKSAVSRQNPQQSEQPSQNRSFAKYLNDMLENQARQSNGSNSIINAVAASSVSNKVNNGGGASKINKL